MSDPLKVLIEGVLSAIEPLVEAADDPDMLAKVLDGLGANDPRLVDANLTAGLRALGQGIQGVRGILAAPELSLSTAQKALEGLRNLVAALKALGAGGGSAYPALGEDLVNLALTNRLRHGSPLLFQLAFALALVQRNVLLPLSVAGEVVRLPRPVDRLVLNDVGTLLRDPIAFVRSDLPEPLLSTVANAQQTADTLVNRLGGVLNALGIAWHYGFDPGDEHYLGDALATASRTLVLYVPSGVAKGAVAGLCIALSSADTDDLGAVLTPFGGLNLQGTAAGWAIDVQLSTDFGALAFGGGKGTKILAPAASGEVRASIKAAPPVGPGGVPFRIGSAKGTRLELGQLQAAVGLTATTSDVEIEVAAGTGASALVLAPSDGDAFLAAILPAGGVRAAFDLGLAWSKRKGLTIRGSAGLDTSIPIALALGPVTLSSIHLGLQAQADGGVAADVSANVSASLGPIHAKVERMGVKAAVSFPAAGGNLGAADLTFGFKPPSGVALSIDVAGVVTGSGFLFSDPAQGLYAGAMQLSLDDRLTVTALGLIATRLPDGQSGYSLLIFITAENFQPIPLGLGFMLTAIGGMVGLNRTFDDAVLREGLKHDTLGSLLFPRDPANNAQAIVRALSGAFPAREGSTLLGLLVRICWGTPTLIQFDLALILELGARKRLLALGRVSARLPRPDNDLVRLTLDAMGVVDRDMSTIALDAVLVDSRIAHKFAITGAGAFRGGWGSGPGNAFVLAIGGFNPRFVPPDGVPALERVTVALSAGANPRLTCQAYFAITANTLQFGARAQLYAAAAGFSLTGDVGFDVLMTSLSHFVADFDASVQLKRGSHNLFKVGVSGTLEGIRPLRLRGKATFEIFWCDFSVNFHATLIDGSPSTVATVDVQPLLLAALAAPSNWRTELGPTPHGVSLRKLPPGGPLVVDPLGRLEVTQSVVPLGTVRDIELVGGARVTGNRRFPLTAQLGGAAAVTTAVRAAFAPGQFFEMSDDARLTSPSFEEMQAGLMVGTTGVSMDPSPPALVAAPLSYLALTLDGPGLTPLETPTPVHYDVTPEQLAQQQATGAAARAPVRRIGHARFGVSAGPAVTLNPARWAIVPLVAGKPDTLMPLPVAPSVTTWAEHCALLNTLNRGGAQWQLVPHYELTS